MHRDFYVPRTDRLVTGFGQTQPSNERFQSALQDRRAYQRAEAPFDGVDMRRIPPLHGRAGLRYEGLQTWNQVDWAHLDLSWAAPQDRLHPQDVSFGGPFTKDATWTVGLRNVLDERYRVHSSGIDAPGAALVVGLHASF